MDDPVQGDHQRAPEETQLKAKFEVFFQCRGVDHLNQDIRCGEARAFIAFLVLGNQRPVIAPEQILENNLVVLAQLMQ